MNFNKVMLMGNLTRDPEMRALPSGTPVCETAIAVNRKWKSQDGRDGEETCFVDLVLFGRQAEVLHQYKKKGDPLFVEGRLKLDTWEAQDGTKRSKHKVVVENFQFLNRSGGQGSYAGADTAQAGGYGGGGGGGSYGGGGGGNYDPVGSTSDFGGNQGGSFGDEDVPF